MLKTKMNERQKRIIVDTAGISLTLIAAIIYLFIGVIWGLWHPYWIVFALIIGLSAVAKIVVEANIKITNIKFEEELKRIKEAEEKEANKIKLLAAPKQVKTKQVKPVEKPVVKLAQKPEPINVDAIIEQKKAEIRKRTLGVDIKETKISSIKEQSVKLTKPKNTKTKAQKEVKAEPVKKVSTTKTPTTKTTTKKVSTTTKLATKQTAKASAKTTTAKKASSTAKKVVKK